MAKNIHELCLSSSLSVLASIILAA